MKVFFPNHGQGHADNPKVNAIVLLRGSLEEAGVR